MFRGKFKTLFLGLLAIITSFILAISFTIFNIPATVAQTDNEQVSSKQIQVNSVSELRDVEPTVWAFQALQSMIERYKMTAIAYPDRTFRGERPARRGELAQWLQSYINVMESRMAESITTSNLATQEDLDELKKSLESLQKSVQQLQNSNSSPKRRI